MRQKNASYTAISRDRNISVAFLKKVLAENGLLNGKEPTESALSNGIAAFKIIENAPYSDGPVRMVLWNTEKVGAILDGAGLEAQTEFKVYSAHSLLDRCSEAGQLLDNLVRAEGAPFMNEPYEIAITDLAYEPTTPLHAIIDGNYLTALEWIRSRRITIETALKRKRKIKAHENYALAMKKLQVAEAWLEKKRRK